MQANPKLTWRDLQHLIVQTSRVTDEKDRDWRRNGAGFHVNKKYGFGLLDAAALVKKARDPAWETAPAQHVCKTKEKSETSGRIFSKKKFISHINTNHCAHDHECVTKLEHVIVYVSLRHERRGSLEINLISPSGTKSKLLGLRKFDMSTKGFRRWPFMTVFHWGENPHGIWKLEIDNTEDFTGTFDRWEMKLYGTCSHVVNSTALERDVCTKHCRKGCPEKFSTVCENCVQYCDCTTGNCTKRCRRGLETDLLRNECTNSSIGRQPDDRDVNNLVEDKPLLTPKEETLPKYGQWLLIAAGIAVSFGILAGIWQGWLYYKTRQKLDRARKQNQMLQYPVVPRNTIVEDMGRVRFTQDRTAVYQPYVKKC